MPRFVGGSFSGKRIALAEPRRPESRRGACYSHFSRTRRSHDHARDEHIRHGARPRGRRHARGPHGRHRGRVHRARGVVPLRVRPVRRCLEHRELPRTRRRAHAHVLRGHRGRQALWRHRLARAPRRVLQLAVALRRGNPGRDASHRLGDVPHQPNAGAHTVLRARHGPHCHVDKRGHDVPAHDGAPRPRQLHDAVRHESHRGGRPGHA